jgi:hypothetical protein
MVCKGLAITSSTLSNSCQGVISQCTNIGKPEASVNSFKWSEVTQVSARKTNFPLKVSIKDCHACKSALASHVSLIKCRLPQDKIVKINTALISAMHRKKITLRSLQSLIGLLKVALD